MKEYIERAAVISIIKTAGFWEKEDSEVAITCVNQTPAAEVAEVRHGRWDENGRCTLCGGHAPFWAMASTYYKSPWCHECGARMDKEDDYEVG